MKHSSLKRSHEYKERIALLSTEIVQRKEKNGDYVKEIALLRDILSCTESKLHKASKLKQKYHVQCDDYESQLRKAQKMIKSGRDQSTKLAEEVELKHQVELDQMRSQMKAKDKEIEAARLEMKDDSESLNIRHREDVAQMRKKMQELNDKLEDYKDLYQKIQLDMEKKRTRFEDEVKSINQDLRECRRTLKTARSENLQYQEIIKQRESRISTLESQIETLNGQIHEITDELHRVNDLYREQSKETQSLKMENNKLQTGLEYKSVDCKRLEESLEESQKKLSSLRKKEKKLTSRCKKLVRTRPNSDPTTALFLESDSES